MNTQCVAKFFEDIVDSVYKTKKAYKRTLRANDKTTAEFMIINADNQYQIYYEILSYYVAK
jgi:hypothetical protein